MSQGQGALASGAAPAGHVLLIDDQDDVREGLAVALRRHGYRVLETANGHEAIELVKQGEFELVVSDVHMPDMDGIELLRSLHESNPDLPVLLLSGNPDLATAMKAVEYGAFEYLTKPVELAKLMSSVERAIAAYRGRLESKRELKQFRSGERSKPPGSSLKAGERWTGALLGGRYRIGKLLGEGGMGAVYEAFREDLAHMRAAVKVLHPELDGNADLVMRFRREAETVAAIDHPNIVKMLDFQQQEDNPVFLVMERLEGLSLSQALAAEGRFAPSRVAFIASQVLAALSAAHAAGVVHRDLKPDNIFLTSMSGLRDIVKVLDFGIAKLLTSNGAPKLTQTGMVLGTPPYMAPEHARGAEVDARTDVYAVGCVMYEALTGHAPFRAANYNALLYAIMEGEPPPLGTLRPDVDPALIAMVKRAMSRNPADRFQTADAMASELRPWVTYDSSMPAAKPVSDVAFAPTLPGNVESRPARPVADEAANDAGKSRE